MGNLACVLAYTERRGSEVICGDRAHIMLHEGGGCAALAGAMMRTLPVRDEDGTWELAAMAAAIRGQGESEDPMFPRTRAVCLENTHCALGGRAVPLAWCREVRRIAHEKGVCVHMDGARLFNAAAQLGCTVADVAACADSVTFSLSKGLGGPCGSVVCGTADFIKKVRRARKMLGGTMHQVGVLAAAGLEVLKGPDVLAQPRRDHANAARLAGMINALGESEVGGEKGQDEGDAVPAQRQRPRLTAEWPGTNMIYMHCDPQRVPAAEMLREMESRGLLAFALSSTTIRLVVHYEVGDADVPGIAQRIGEAAVAGEAATVKLREKRSGQGGEGGAAAVEHAYGRWNTN
jgi:threonine aldolase